MASNKSYNSQSYENLKTLDSIYCQLCRITNSKQFEDSMYDYLPHEIDIDKYTRVYTRRIHALIVHLYDSNQN